MSLDNVRQPQPVKIAFEGDPRDIENYKRRIALCLTRSSLDNVETNGNKMTIYPAAVND